MPPLVNLVWAADRLKLFNELEKENKIDTCTVRGMLWLIISRKIEDGQVFVDDWPRFSHVCCLHSSKIYAPNSDRDLITIATSDQNTFGAFVLALLETRKWNLRQGVIGCWVEENLVSFIQSLMHQHFGSRCSFWTSYTNQMSTSHKRENLDWYVKEWNRTLANCPPGFFPSKMRPEEASVVAASWPHPIPDKEDMFRWLISILPAPCLRDEEGKLVAYGITYSFCGPGAGFVLPEYRGRHLMDIVNMPALLDLMRICPTQVFHSVRIGNDASTRQVARTSIDYEVSDTRVRWFVYTPLANGEQEDSKTILKSML